MFLITIWFYNDLKRVILAERVTQTDRAFHLSVDGCDVCIPSVFFKDGEVKQI